MRLNVYRRMVLQAIDRAAEGGNISDLRKEVSTLGHERKPRKAKDLTDQADELFSLIVRARGKCEECGSTTDLQAAHGFSRRYKGTRWDERQVFCLCKGCHYYYGLRPLEWKAWMVVRLGQDGYDATERRARHSIRKMDLRMIVVGLEAQAKRLGVWPRKPA